MKKLSILVAGLLMGGLMFTGCDDNDLKSGDAAVVANDYDKWTYFNFSDGRTTTLEIKKLEGAVTGLYTGDLKGVGEYFSDIQLENVKVAINRVSADSVDVELMDVTLEMNGRKYGPFTVVTRAEAKEVDGKWELTSKKSETLVGETIYIFEVSGTIGKAKDSEVVLNCAIKPGAMPMAITMTYTSTVENNYTYEVDATEEGALKWDIAVHKYNMRTNGGLVKKLDARVFDAVTVENIPADEDMVADTDGSVMADMTQMQSGFVGYQDVKLNKELGGWVTATPTGTMPPYTYELNDNVFIVKVNGKVWKLQFSAYTAGGKTAAVFYYEELK